MRVFVLLLYYVCCVLKTAVWLQDVSVGKEDTKRMHMHREIERERIERIKKT